jgi:hypothetical protein
MLKAIAMMRMKTIPPFITNIMSSAENLAPDAAATACAGDLATAEVNDNTRPISSRFWNFDVSLMVQLCMNKCSN